VEDVAQVTAFLAPPEAAYLTGQAINVSGGAIMH
jgi:NAD(P)-dependent dehydrogenase (short-subunit alcohol dehydrogenase family)